MLGHYRRGSGAEATTARVRSAARAFLTEQLARLTPDVPVRTDAPEAVAERVVTGAWWCVDPLDGAGAFARGEGTFTVSLALVESGVPVLGVVGVPARGHLYVGGRGLGASRAAAGECPVPIRTRRADPGWLTVAMGRGHRHPVVSKMKVRLYVGGVRTVSKRLGSSLALCLVAEGRADLAPSAAPEAGWSTAAAQAVVESAGGLVTDCAGRRMTYGTARQPSPMIVAAGDPELDWRRYAGPASSVAAPSMWPAPPSLAPTWTV